VTVLRGPAGPLAAIGAGPVAWPIGFFVALAVAITVFVATASPAARRTTAPGPAAAYAYPIRCVSEAIALHDPRFASAAFDRTIPSCPPRNGIWLDHDAPPQ
jgi:hypothetical protein